jgi:hypothetical protein
MSRHQQPDEIARLKGADKKDPQRYRAEIPKSSRPLGSAPDHLGKQVEPDPAACWFELETYCIPGVLTGADRIAMEMLATLLAEYRADPAKFPSTKLNQLSVMLGRFGMTPSDRTKLGVEKSERHNAFDNLDD